MSSVTTGSCGHWLRRARLLLAATTIIGVLSGTSLARSLPPKDECSADSSFRAFKAELLEAVARKDSRYLLSIVSPNIRIHLGPGGEGPAAFMEEWKLDQAASSPIWDELSAALALGCARDRGEMSSPYLFSRFPDDLDALESVIVIESEAVLRAAPHRTASAMARLSAWKILTRTQPHGGDERWLGVRTSNGQPGYVEVQAVRSPSDFRVVFEKSDGRWMMTYLLAGD